MSDEIYYDENRNVIPMPLDEWKLYQAQQASQNQGNMVTDANGNTLEAGDTIIAIKDLPIKGGSKIKRGDKFTNISFTDDATHVKAKHKNHGTLFLKTEFFKKG